MAPVGGWVMVFLPLEHVGVSGWAVQRSPVPSLSVCGRPVERCMTAMQAGTQMVKLRGSSKGLARFYFLDAHGSCIRWRPSRKNEKAKSECVAWLGRAAGTLPEWPL